MQSQALLLHLVKVVIATENACFAAGEHHLHVVLVLFAVSAAWVCDATLLALLPGLLDHFYDGGTSGFNRINELLEDFFPLVLSSNADTLLYFF